MPSEAEYNEQALFDERQAIKRERDELRADNERLRAALAHIRQTHQHPAAHPKAGCETCKALSWVAGAQG